MNCLQNFSRLMLATFTILTTIEMASAEPVVKLAGQGTIELSIDGPSHFVLSGNASHFGKYSCFGEIAFSPGTMRGTLEGEGVAVIRAANGDLIVGIVKWQVDADGNGHSAFSWRDSVQFSDGTVVSSTGRFIRTRPAGAINRLKLNEISDGTSNIIAILIG